MSLTSFVAVLVVSCALIQLLIMAQFFISSSRSENPLCFFFCEGSREKFSSRQSESEWIKFFTSLDQDTQKSENELTIERFIQTTTPRHELCERFPLKPIPIVLETSSGICLLGSHLLNGTICENSVRGKSRWSPDPHVRDIITTVLFTCALRSQPDNCFAIDVGSNVGAHTMVMLELGARVVSIEPQQDLCVATRFSASALGYASRSRVICGGVAPNKSTPRNTLFMVKNGHRYNGFDPFTTSFPYTIGPVPMIALERLVGTKSRVDFLKIDTDSFDCATLEQAIHMMSSHGVVFRAFLLETWDDSCLGGNLIGHQILKLARMGYSVYRTLVFERSWDEHHRDYKNDFTPVSLPQGWTEEFHVGFNFVLWRADTQVLSDEELLSHPLSHPNWQYLFTKGISIVQAGYHTLEL
jgi:FkbM family methyltransferase